MSDHPSTFLSPFPGAPAAPKKSLHFDREPRGGSVVPRNPLKTGRPIERQAAVVRPVKGFIVALIPTPATVKVSGLDRDSRFFLAADNQGSMTLGEAIVFSTREAASRAGTRVSRGMAEVGAFQVLDMQSALEKYGSKTSK